MIAIFIVFTTIAAIGTWFSARSKDLQIKKQRWVKFGIYLLLLTAINTFNYFNMLWLPGLIIAFAAGFEFIPATLRRIQTNYRTVSIFIFLLLILEFLTGTLAIPNMTFFYVYPLVLVFDGFSQIIGHLAGGKKIFPATSPNKTLGGLIGGITFCVLVAVVNDELIDLNLWQRVAAGIMVSATACTGDWLASYHKRKMQVKDFGDALPGQGGFIDRYDSLIFTIAIYATAISLNINL